MEIEKFAVIDQWSGDHETVHALAADEVGIGPFLGIQTHRIKQQVIARVIDRPTHPIEQPAHEGIDGELLRGLAKDESDGMRAAGGE